MARTRNASASSSFLEVQKQARRLVVKLRKEIRSKEAELSRLREEEGTLGRLTGRVRAAARNLATAGRGRINWRTILVRLPKQFKASHIREVRGLKHKRPSEIFAAITRWIEAGLVRRKSRGLYERA